MIDRAEIREWLEANVPAGMRDMPASTHAYWGGRKTPFESNDQQLWLERMVEKGWTVPTWPVEYGGAGMSAGEAAMLDRELARMGVVKPLANLGIWMLGPALLEFGNEEQKCEHLPRIARGEIRWCQGYSEPGAGSDLASVKARGVVDGDDFLVSGQKVWTTHADKADWMFALVRTEPDAPKHQGISFLLFDMETPGVSTRPLRLISGDEHFCETFLDEVRVPMSQTVGKRGQGWEICRYLLRHERAMMGSAMGGGGARLPVSELARASAHIAGRPALREEVVDIELDAWALDIWIERMRDEARAGVFDASAPSALKVFGTELSKRRAEKTLALAGPDGLASGSDETYNWLNWPAGTIGGGTTEIQLNIIARRGLGLPEK